MRRRLPPWDRGLQPSLRDGNLPRSGIRALKRPATFGGRSATHARSETTAGERPDSKAAGCPRRGREGAWAILAVLVLAGVVLGGGRTAVAAEAPAQPASPAPAPPSGMVWIPAGEYRPFFRSPADPAVVAVRGFALDVRAVTHGEFLAFVRENPAWRRSAVKRLFADESYLRSWAGDLEPGSKAPVEEPVTWVSWFAARAYARWVGKRLPTIAEWEFAAAGPGSSGGGVGLPGMAGGAAEEGEPPANGFGVRDLNRQVWEWVVDFNTAMVTGDARGDSGLDRRLFCGAGAQGARDPSDFNAFMRFGFRSSLQAPYCIHNLGFRCAQDR